MESPLRSIVSTVRTGWRYRWHALITSWVLFALAALAIFLLPNKFESRAQIYVDTKSILRPLLEGLAVTADTDAQADVVRRALLARPTLEKVARKNDLYVRTRNARDADDLLSQLAKKIAIDGDARSSIYTITYADPNPRTAQGVVQSLLDTFVEDSLGQDRSDSESAQKFLRQQVAEHEQRLNEAESRLAEFKKDNVGMMPDESGDYFQRLQQEESAVEKLAADLSVAVRQQRELRRKIVGDAPGAQLPSANQIQSAQVIDAQLADSRRELDSLLLRFTEKHPQVIALRETITRLTERRVAEAGTVRATTGIVQRNNGEFSGDSVVQDLQIALNNADLQVASMRARLGEGQRRVGRLRQALTVGPEVEAELQRLNRDYGVTRSRYEALLQRLESAKISDRADRSSELKFRVLDPPRVPLKPSSPFRPLLLAAALFLALGVGALLAIVLASMRSVFLDRRSLEDFVGASVIGVVTRARSADEAGVLERDRKILIAAAAALAVAFLGSVMVSDAIGDLLRRLLGVGFS